MSNSRDHSLDPPGDGGLFGSSAPFDDFSDLLTRSSISGPMLGADDRFQDDLNPFADVMSPLSSAALYNGIPTSANRDEESHSHFTTVDFAPKPTAVTTSPLRSATRSSNLNPAYPGSSPGLPTNEHWDDVPSSSSATTTVTSRQAINPLASPGVLDPFAAEAKYSPTMGLSADLPSLTVDTANSSDPSSIMERLASIEIGPNSPLPGGSHSGGLSSPQFAEAEPPVDALRSPAQSPLSHGLGLPDHLDPATTLDLNSVRLETGANSGLPSVSNSSTLESPTTTSNGGLFEITVSDPHKIGDAMSAHVVYKVHTKTSQPGFDSEEYSVRRRYRDFEWLFNQLASTHPGVVIPPMPEKQSLGRFQDDFVESRRFALEKYLRKISVHSLLQADDDFKIFLTSENFTIETRVRRPETSRGFFGVFGEVMSGSFSKYSETDEWFENRKDQLDALESQLRSLLKAIDTTIKQRKELAVAHGEFGQALRALGEAEASPQLARSFEIFSELQDHLRQLQERQASFDVKTFESTTDEYIRTIGSIKLTLTARVKAYQVWQADAAELHRKTSSYDRLRNQTRFRTDRTSQLQAEIGQLEIQTENHRHEFEDISTLIRAELERFDREKVLDFKESAEQFLSSMVDHQQKVIRLWEAYLTSFNQPTSAHTETY